MPAVTFDTHEFIRTLESAGMPTQQAEAVSVAVRKAQEAADVATKGDVSRLDSKVDVLAAKVDGLRGELSAQRWLLGFIAASVLSLVVRTFF